jgi:hypothetical protein
MPTMSRALAILAAILLSAVAPASAQDSAPTTSRPQNRAAEIAAKIQREVEDVRGLKLDAPVKIGLHSTAELRAYVEKAFERDFPAPRRAATERALKALGLLPPEFDLTHGLLELLTEQIAGFYDPAAAELRLVERSESDAPDDAATQALKLLAKRGAGLDEITMAHELVHALQDGAFGLRRLPLDGAEDDDLALASQSLVEGDATLAMAAWAQKKQGVPVEQAFNPRLAKAMAGTLALAGSLGGAKLSAAPAYLRESLTFPYAEGYRFCVEIGAADRSFRAIDAALRAPPRSSEQILHPAKFDGPERDDPERIAFPDLAAALGGGARLTSNVLGEFGFRLLFADGDAPTSTRTEARVRRKDAERAAAGWDGDRYVVYARDGAEDALVLASTWDADADAAEAAAALRALRRADGGARFDVEVGADRAVFAFRGVPADRRAAVRAALDRGLVRTPLAVAPLKEPVK